MQKEEPVTFGLMEGVLGPCRQLPAPPSWMLRDEVTASESADALAVVGAATIHQRDRDRERPTLQVREEKRKTIRLVEARNHHAERGGVSIHRCHKPRSARQSMSFFRLS